MTELPTRRDFLKQTALAATALAGTSLHGVGAGSPPGQSATALPWYRRTLRWGQTNITEMDPERHDIAWWRNYWHRTQTQGVIINAGGMVAYYPSRVPLHRPAQHLNGRDLFGELCRAAHEDGLVVLARMDSNLRPSCVRLSSAIARRASRTTVGAAWAEAAPAPVRTARNDFASGRARQFPLIRAGTIRFTASGYNGTTSVGSNSGT